MANFVTVSATAELVVNGVTEVDTCDYAVWQHGEFWRVGLASDGVGSLFMDEFDTYLDALAFCAG